MFMIFWYPNGTDSIINIKEYFYNAQDSNNDFFEFLMMNRIIENNIFGYSPIGAIRFTHIPSEIKILILNSENADGEGEGDGAADGKGDGD